MLECEPPQTLRSDMIADKDNENSAPPDEPRDEAPDEAPAESAADADAAPSPEEKPAPEASAGEPERQQAIFAVRIGKLQRRYPFAAPEDFAQHTGRTVVVDADYGLDIGVLGEEWPDDSATALGAVVRLADADDLAQMLHNAESDAECTAIFNESVADEGLEMKLVGIDHSYERGKITFYYHAEGRVDFRQLVKTLASKLRRRIELYQLNLRDQFLFHPFVGPCGRELCCKSKPELFSQKVPTRLAKQQKLSYNPAKMAGMCGKPRCCLHYEIDSYKEFAEFLGVKPGRPFRRRSDGLECRLVDWNMLTGEVVVEAPDEQELTFGFDEFRREFEPKTPAKSRRGR